MGERPVLSISMLISNNPSNVRRSLDSLKVIMESLPCELILVSTTNDKQLRDIMLEYTDKIVDFKWCNDFSKARNAGIACATGEWFLTLDDDDWFVEPKPLIDFFISGEYKKYGCANYLTRNFYDPQYEHYSDSWVSRMIKLDKDTHYESKIHEYLYPVHGECKNVRAIAYHSGYIFVTEEQRQAHFRRNSVLLKEMIEEEPNRLRWRVQLIQEYRGICDYDHMYKDGIECLKLFEDIDNFVDNRDICTFYVAAAMAKVFLEDFDEAYRVGALAIKDSRTNEMCHAFMMQLFGFIFYRKGKWADAEHALRTYFQIGDYFKQNPRRYEIQQGALLVSEAFDEMTLKKVYSILILCGLKRKDTKPLKRYFKELCWEQNNVYLMDGFMSDLVESMAHLKEEKFFVKVVELAWKHSELRKALLLEVAPYEEKDPKGYSQIAHYLSQIEADHWYLWYTKIYVANEGVSGEKFISYMRGLISSIPNMFNLPDGVISKANDRGLSMEDSYLSFSLEKWEQDWRAYVVEHLETEVRHTAKMVHGMQTKQDVHYDLFAVMEAEYEAFSAEDGSMDYNRIHQRLDKFTKLTVSFVKKYPDQQKEMGEIAQKIAEALELENEYPQEAVGRMAEISQIVPGYASAIKNYLIAFNDYYQNKEKYAKQEMENLKAKVLLEVQKSIVDKDYVTALSILEQLKQMIPSDLDIAEITLQTRLLYVKQQG